MTWNFAILAMDQIVNNAAKLRHMSGGQLRCPIVFRGPNGAGGRLSSQHSQSLEANYAHFPGLKVIAPATPGRRQGPAQGGHPRRQPGHLHRGRAALRREGRGARRRARACRIGKADIKREGSDVTLITWSRMYYFCRAGGAGARAGGHRRRGRSTCARSSRSTRRPILASVRKTNRVVVVEEGWQLLRRRRADRRTSSSARRSTTSTRRSSRVTGLDVNMALRREPREARPQPSAERIIAAVKKVLYREEGT